VKKPATPFKAVIFDMDGVLVDSEPIHTRAVLEVLEEIGYGRSHGLKMGSYIGRSDTDVWRDFIIGNNPRQSLEELLAMKRARTIAILLREKPLFPDVRKLIGSLARTCALAVASGSEREVVEVVLESNDLRRFFPVVVTGSDIQHGKPAPDIFLQTAQLLGVEPGDCWVIEDSKPGIAAALAAGMRVLALTHTHRAEELRTATQVAANFKEIQKFLLSAKGDSDTHQGQISG
jgi:HAD superfamily hydrolase (TIGR01509 family)